MEWGRSSEGGEVPGGEPGGEPDGVSDGVSGGGCGRVLVCDDTEQIRRLIRVNLELDGYEVVEAEDGPAALEILQDVTRPLPDVITVDVVMPRRDGWWMVSAIRADPRLAHIPIVMVTASAQFQDRRQAEEATVDEFVAKPFDPEELLAKIEALVGDHRV
jgi:CheY-like chemotaxis protein